MLTQSPKLIKINSNIQIDDEKLTLFQSAFKPLNELPHIEQILIDEMKIDNKIKFQLKKIVKIIHKKPLTEQYCINKILFQNKNLTEPSETLKLLLKRKNLTRDQIYYINYFGVLPEPRNHIKSGIKFINKQQYMCQLKRKNKISK
jgi:hypothetical protein